MSEYKMDNPRHRQLVTQAGLCAAVLLILMAGSWLFGEKSGNTAVYGIVALLVGTGSLMAHFYFKSPRSISVSEGEIQFRPRATTVIRIPGQNIERFRWGKESVYVDYRDPEDFPRSLSLHATHFTSTDWNALTEELRLIRIRNQP